MRKMNHKISLMNYIIFILFCAVVLTACKEENNNKNKTNIILIVADDLGYGDLGCYGQKEIKTPNIDRLAKNGLLFTDHYSGSTVCAPSRASLMTGLHTGHVQIRGNSEVKPMGQKPLQKGTVTLASKLKEAGYITGLFGKWGLGSPGSTGIPNRQGFDHFFGYLCQRHAHNYYPEFLFRNQDSVKLTNIVANDRLDGAGEAKVKKEYAYSIIADEAIQFVETNKNDPFLLVLTPTIPHANNEAGPRGMEVPDYGIYKDKNWPDAQKGHAAMITLLDSDVGRIIAKLEELKIDESTLVIFTSDNGPHGEGGFDPDFNNSNGSLRGIKRDLYEGGIRVPMIAYWPGTIKPERKSELISAFWDYLPTFCDIAGVNLQTKTDGISFLPTLLALDDQQKHEYLYWEFHWWKSTRFAVRKGDWKAVKNSPNGEVELYDLKKDIEEKNNFASEYPKIVMEIEDIIKESRTESEEFKIKYY